jgi:hypothetical protein
VEHQCDWVHKTSGRCPATATHVWEGRYLCCTDFDHLSHILLSLKDSVAESHHRQVIALIEENTNRIIALIKSLWDCPEER